MYLEFMGLILTPAFVFHTFVSYMADVGILRKHIFFITLPVSRYLTYDEDLQWFEAGQPCVICTTNVYVCSVSLCTHRT
jgi:hypothetical protein